MVTIWLRWTALTLMAVVLAVLVTSNVALRRDAVDARDTAADLRRQTAEVEEHVADLSADRARLEAEWAVADRRLDVSTDRLEAAQQAEAEALTRLGQRREERETAQEELRVLQASVTAASEQTEQNEASLRALDQCLDGATRAANALSVGDVTRALRSVEDVRGACAQVGVVIGS